MIGFNLGANMIPGSEILPDASLRDFGGRSNEAFKLSGMSSSNPTARRTKVIPNAGSSVAILSQATGRERIDLEPSVRDIRPQVQRPAPEPFSIDFDTHMAHASQSKVYQNSRDYGSQYSQIGTAQAQQTGRGNASHMAQHRYDDYKAYVQSLERDVQGKTRINLDRERPRVSFTPTEQQDEIRIKNPSVNLLKKVGRFQPKYEYNTLQNQNAPPQEYEKYASPGTDSHGRQVDPRQTQTGIGYIARPQYFDRHGFSAGADSVHKKSEVVQSSYTGDNVPVYSQRSVRRIGESGSGGIYPTTQLSRTSVASVHRLDSGLSKDVQKKESIYKDISIYYGDPEMIKYRQQDKYAFYAVSYTCGLIKTTKYLICAVINDFDRVGIVKRLSDIKWEAFQTRTFDEPISDDIEIPFSDKCGTVIPTLLGVQLSEKNSDMDASYYVCETEPIKVRIMYKTKSSRYSSKGTLKMALDVYSTVLEFDGI